MASGDRRKSFTFIWKLKNVNYLQKMSMIFSPPFVIDGMKWTLYLISCCEITEHFVELCLGRHPDNKNTDKVEINYELVFLALDGTVLQSLKKIKKSFLSNGPYESDVKENERLLINRSLLQDIFTIRCRIWESGVEISEDVQCLTHTRMEDEKKSFVLNIQNFSTFENSKKYSYHIKSLNTCENLMTLDLYLTAAEPCSNRFRVAVSGNDPKIWFSTFQFSLVDASGNKVESFKKEFNFVHDRIKVFSQFPTVAKKLEMEDTYLPNNVLTIHCDCALYFGVIEKYCYESRELDNLCIVKTSVLTPPKTDLADDLKLMLNNKDPADVEIRTSTKSFPAHKCILSSQSPVFNAMFANHMLESINNYVDIKDLNDDTILRMLLFIYGAEVGDLDWGSAIELYEAADKYEILRLKDVCSCYLKTNLCESNACEAMVLADLHQDKELKRVVQNFMISHEPDFFCSVEFQQLTKTHPKLALGVLNCIIRIRASKWSRMGTNNIWKYMIK